MENKPANKQANLFQKIELKIDQQSDLKKRLISSIFLFIFMVIYVGCSIIYQQGTWKGLSNANIAGYFNFGISVVLCALASYELMKAMGVQKVKNGTYLMIGGMFLGAFLFFFPWNINHHWALTDAMKVNDWDKWYVIFLINIFCIAAFLFIGKTATKSWAKSFMFLIYMYVVVMGFKGFSTIALTMQGNNMLFGWNTIIWVWGTIILTDSFAYLGGRQFGKTPLAPKISPKKTWEGSGIGSGVAIISGALYAILFFYLKQDYSPFVVNMGLLLDTGRAVPGIILALMTILISFAGQIGDLFFSFYKRIFGIKDFSKLIPGHGGILDRMDSFLFVFFILYFICIAGH